MGYQGNLHKTFTCIILIMVTDMESLVLTDRVLSTSYYKIIYLDSRFIIYILCKHGD